MKKLLLSLLTVAATAFCTLAAETVEFDFTPANWKTANNITTVTGGGQTTEKSFVFNSYTFSFLQAYWQAGQSGKNTSFFALAKNASNKLVIDQTDKTPATAIRICSSNDGSATGLSNLKLSIKVGDTTVGNVTFPSGSAKGAWSNSISIPENLQGQPIIIYNTITSKIGPFAKIELTLAEGGETPEPETVADPEFTPASGAELSGDQTVSIACATEGATIHYTINGGADTEYNAPISFTESGEYTVVAYAIKGETKSANVTATYTYTATTVTPEPETVAVPTFEPGNGAELTGDETVTISCATEGATIHYTINDGDILVYNQPITFDANGTYTIAAYAAKGNIDSEVVEATYTYTASSTVDPEPTPESLVADFVFGGANQNVTIEGKVASNTNSDSNNIDGVNVSSSNNAINITFAQATNTQNPPRWFISNSKTASGEPEVRLYGGNTIEVSVNGKYKITSIEFGQKDGTDWNPGTPSVGSFDSKVWNAPEDQDVLNVTFKPSGKMFFQTVKVTYVSTDTTGISEVEAEGAEVEWYDLSGRRVAEPVKGIYIRRQGNKAVKMAF